MAAQRDTTATLIAVGDIGPHYDEPVEPLVEQVLPVLKQGDIRFAQCESVYSEEGANEKRYPVGRSVLHPKLASVYTTAGINTVCLASNHTYDYHELGVLHNIETFQKLGITAFGTGRNLQEARKAAFTEKKGVKVAFLGYCSVMRDTEYATKDRSGMTPMRVRTWYEPTEHQAAAAARTMSLAYEEDVEAMVEDIRKAKQQADVVIVSIHWGVHNVPKTIAMYQPRVAHTAIDAGADLILGSHTHNPKAIEVYKGKVCFYSLANFITDNPFGPRNTDGAKTCIAKITLSKKGVERVAFVPTLIDAKGRPEPLQAGDQRFGDLVKYWEWVSDAFPHRFQVEGNEVVITAP